MKLIDGFIVDVKVLAAHGAAYKLCAETRHPEGLSDVKQWHVPFQGVIVSMDQAQQLASRALEGIKRISANGQPHFNLLKEAAVKNDWWVPAR